MPAIYRMFIFVLLLTFSIPSSVLASFSIPTYVYTVNQMDTVRNLAKRKGKPVSFVYSDKKTDCGLATAPSKDLFQGLNNYSIVVYLEHKDWNRFPDIVKTGINSSESSRYTPKTIVVDSDLTSIICIIPYAQTKQRKQLIKQAQSVNAGY